MFYVKLFGWIMILGGMGMLLWPSLCSVLLQWPTAQCMRLVAG